MSKNFIQIRNLILALAAMCPFFSYATHIVGGEISYECLGNNQYKITLDVYRDCFYGQAPFDAPAHITIYKGDGTIWNNLNVAPLFIDTIANNIAGDPCLFVPSDVCVDHARYEGTVTLPLQATGYFFVYQRCCRNETVSNIFDPDQTGSTYWIQMTQQAMEVCNDSPKFGFYPPVFVCVNKPIHHPHAATETQGDSLVYKFFTPFKGATFSAPQPPFASPPPYDTVVWVNPPYNLGQLLGPGGQPLAINSLTGLITGNPVLQGQFVVGVEVREYRNGMLLSILRRDFQYNVGVCGEIIPEIVAPPAQCDNLTVQFGNNTDVANNFIWHFDYPNASPSSNGVAPTFTFADTGTYVVQLIAEPGNQCEAIGYDTVFLQYNSTVSNFSWQTYDCTSESVLVLTNLSTDNVSPIISWNWTVHYGSTNLTSTLPNPVFEIPPSVTGTIKLTVNSLNGCTSTKTVNFQSGLNDPVDLLPTNVQICLGSPAQLNPNGPSQGFTYFWAAPVPPSQSAAVNPTVAPLQNTNYFVTITGYGGLCQSTASVPVTVNPLPQLNFQPDSDCNGKVVHFLNASFNAPQGYVWNFGDPGTLLDVSTQANPTYTYANYGTYTVTLMTSPLNLCKDTITQQVMVSEKLLDAAFSYDYSGCSETAVAIDFFDVSVNNQNNTVTRLWQFSGVYNGTSNQANPSITVTQQGTLNVKLTITTAENCTDATLTTALNIDFTELPGLNVNGGNVLGCLNGGVTLNAGGNSQYIYHWSPATGLSCTNCPSPHANPSVTTTYTVEVVNLSADTCSISKQVTVTVPQNVGLVATNDVTTCESFATLSANTTLLPVTYEWTDENSNPVNFDESFTVPVSGYDHYTVRATDQFGCHYFDPVYVTGGPVNIATSGDQIKCSNEPLAVFVTNLDGNDTLTYQWTPDDSFNGPTNVPNPNVVSVIGEQWLEVFAENQFGCEDTDSVFVAIVDANAELDFTSLVECSGSIVQFTNTSQNAYGYVWNFGDPTTLADTSHEDSPAYVYPSIGTYTVTLDIIYDVSCVDPVTKLVDIPEPVFTPDFTFEYVSCQTDTIEVLFHDITVANLSPVSAWLWTTQDGQTSTLSDPVFIVPAGEDFEVTMQATADNGCEGTITKELKLEFFDVGLEDTLVLCQGDSAFINPNVNTSYEWNWTPNIGISDPHAANPLVYPTQTTLYTVEVTNFTPDTCSIIRTVLVYVPPKIEANASGDTLSCGAPIVLTGNSNLQPTTFEWFEIPGSLLGNEQVLEILPPYNFYLEMVAKDQYGCPARDTLFVRNETVDVASLLVSPECPEEEITLTVSNNIASHDLNYLWTATAPGAILPPNNQATVTALTAPHGQSATYSVTATNQFGCSQTLSQTVATYDFVPTVVPSVEACAGVATSLNPGADDNLNYVWSPSTGLFPGNLVPNPFVTIYASATYSVTVSDAFGLESCTEIFEVPVTVPTIINITETVDTFTCGSPIVIGATTNVPTSLTWFDAAGILIGTGNTLTVNPTTVATYSVMAEDNFGCMAQENVTVSNNQLDLHVDGSGVIDTCPMPSYNICITNLDPMDMLTYEWTAGNGGTILSGDGTACPEVATDAGTTIFTANISNQWGCETEENISVTTYEFEPIIRETLTVCPGVPTAINTDAAASTLQYFWTPQTGLSCYNCPNPLATLTENQAYSVEVFGYNGADTCSFGGTVQVIVMPAIGLGTFPSDSSVCEPVPVTLAALTTSLQISSIEWFELPGGLPAGSGNVLIVTPQQTETYLAVATDTLGCVDSATVNLYAYPINISLDDNFDYCVENEPLTITIQNNDPTQVVNYDWSPEPIEQNPTGSEVVIIITDTTEFHIVATNQFGCTGLDSTTVFYYDIVPTITEIFQSEDTIIFNSGEFSQLEVELDPTYTYEWTPIDGLDDPNIHNPIATPEVTTTYKLKVTNEGGCYTEDTITVYVINPECREPNIFLPNAFTPNSDGENDVLFVRSNILESFELAIYNRWGQKVFESTDQNAGWDGSFKKELLTPDVYGYYLKGKCYNGEDFFKKGNVTLLR